MYKDSLQMEDAVSNIRKILDVLLSDECTGVLFHCLDGKDRTGLVAIIILMILGVTDEQVNLDYMASAIPEHTKIEICDDYYTFHHYDAEVIMNSRREKSVDYKLMESIQKWLVEKYGTMENYVYTVLKLDNDFINKLRNKYLN